MHSAFRPFCLQPPAEAPPCQGTLPFGRSDRDCFPTGTRGFATALQARHLSPAESSSVSSPTGETSYGLVVHLLLPHPVLRRRSCSRLQVALTWRGLSPLRLNALSGAQCGGLTPPSTIGRSPSRRRVAKLEGKIHRFEALHDSVPPENARLRQAAALQGGLRPQVSNSTARLFDRTAKTFGPALYSVR
jgi:hypothetical protein